MDKDEMIVNNKLIAEFMGADIKTPKEDDIIYMSIPMCNDLCLPNNCGAVKVRHLDYDESWDWLMPVVEKIDAMGYTTLIKNYGDEYSNFVEILNTDEDPSQICCFTEHVTVESKLSLTYKAVVEFINWRNG